MSIFFKARGTNSFGIFILRLVLGTYMLTLGIRQANDIQGYIERIKSLGAVSDNLAFIVAFILPFASIVFGGLYIMGFFTPASSLALAVIMLGKIIVRGIFPADGIPFNKDIVFLACFLFTMFAGAGVISFDVFLDKKKKKVKTTSTESSSTVTSAEQVVTEAPKQEQAPNG